MEELRNKNYSQIEEKITGFLDEELKTSGKTGFVFGLSGGIDSAILAYLCSRENFANNSLALIMPDSNVSPREDTEDALFVAQKLKLDYKLIDISLIHYEFSKYLEPDKFALSNLRTRIRSSIIYYYANSKNYLVLGSSDKSEYLIGYFTKYGDGSADLLPIVSLYKTQIRELARHFGVPQRIIEKKSSPQLWQGQTAEGEIGVDYEKIDSILYTTVEQKISTGEASRLTQLPQDTVEKIYNMYLNTAHKRGLPKTPTV